MRNRRVHPPTHIHTHIHRHTYTHTPYLFHQPIALHVNPVATNGNAGHHNGMGVGPSSSVLFDEVGRWVVLVMVVVVVVVVVVWWWCCCACVCVWGGLLVDPWVDRVCSRCE